MGWDASSDEGVECPYCGDVYDDDDKPRQSTLWECPACEKEFLVQVEYTATYFSTKPETEILDKEESIRYWKDSKHVVSEEYSESIVRGEEKRRDELQKLVDKNNAKQPVN